MAASQVFRPEARVELLGGKIVDLSPLGPFHASVINRLSRRLTLSADGRWLVSIQNPVHLDDYSEPHAESLSKVEFRP